MKNDHYPMQPDDLISFTNAAREIECSRATLYRAVKDGRLNDVKVSGRRMLVKDSAWENFEPLLRGGRVRKIKEDNQCE